MTRRLARLSRNQLAAVIGCSAESIRKWECDRQNRTADRIAWLLFLCYIVPDPEFGWLRAALGLSPHGKIPPGVAQIVAQPPGKWTQVAGYKRRHRNRKLSKS
ncbi:MAG: hypothetical protein AB9869_17790 [Verrucomicrobiia bacterium]